MISVPKHLQRIIQNAAKAAIPELTDVVQVNTEDNKQKDPTITWDYSSPCAM